MGREFRATEEEVDLPEDIKDEVLQKVVLLLLTVNENEALAARIYLKPLEDYKRKFEFHDQVVYYIGNYGACPAAIRVILPGSDVRGGAATACTLASS